MAEMRKCALHPIVAPRGIVTGHPQNQLGYLPRDSRPAWSPLSVGPLASDEIAIPGEERVGRHQVGVFLEYLSAEPSGFESQSSLVVRQMQSTTPELLSETDVP